jgi:hypothetical protein
MLSLLCIAGVNFSRGETDRPLMFIEQEPNHTDDEATNPRFRFAEKKFVGMYSF